MEVPLCWPHSTGQEWICGSHSDSPVGGVNLPSNRSLPRLPYNRPKAGSEGLRVYDIHVGSITGSFSEQGCESTSLEKSSGYSMDPVKRTNPPWPWESLLRYLGRGHSSPP